MARFFPSVGGDVTSAQYTDLPGIRQWEKKRERGADPVNYSQDRLSRLVHFLGLAGIPAFRPGQKWRRVRGKHFQVKM